MGVCLSFQLEKQLLINLRIGCTRGFLGLEHSFCVSFQNFWTHPLPQPPVLSAQKVTTAAPRLQWELPLRPPWCGSFQGKDMGRNMGGMPRKVSLSGKSWTACCCAEENPSSNRRLCQHSAVSLAPSLHTWVDTSALSYRCSTAFRIEPLTIQLFEHMCIFHSTNHKNMAAGLQRLTPRARMREAEKVFLGKSVYFLL